MKGRTTKIKKMREWLLRPCLYVDHQYEDPGYSIEYRQMFGNYEDYEDAKIDLVTPFKYIKKVNNINDEDNGNNGNNETPEYTNMTVTPDCPRASSMGKSSYLKHMYILPGSNHSNAYYFYMMLMRSMDRMDIFNIPIVSADPSEPYNGKRKKFRMGINKLGAYSFVKDHSEA